MKTIMTAAAAAMLLASPIVTADSADAHRRHWSSDHGHYWKHHHRHYVRKRHHRWVRRGGVVIRIIVVPGYPAYYGCGGYCW